MKPRLRSLGLRAAVVFATMAALFGVSTASPVPPVPLSLLASFDEAFTLVSEAAEQRIAALEQPPPERARARTVAALLARFEREVNAACDAAHDAFVAAITADRSSDQASNQAPSQAPSQASSQAPSQRARVLSMIDHQLAEARGALACTTDPEVRAEYEQTCAWLREIRCLI